MNSFPWKVRKGRIEALLLALHLAAKLPYAAEKVEDDERLTPATMVLMMVHGTTYYKGQDQEWLAYFTKGSPPPATHEELFAEATWLRNELALLEEEYIGTCSMPDQESTDVALARWKYALVKCERAEKILAKL